MRARSRPWSELDTQRYRESLKRIHDGKKWRSKEAEAGRPSSFEDYCHAHGLCSACQTVGLTWSPAIQGFKVVGMDGDTQMFEVCEVCGGTGRLPVP
jgi:hypothetical protein